MKLQIVLIGEAAMLSCNTSIDAELNTLNKPQGHDFETVKTPN